MPALIPHGEVKRDFLDIRRENGCAEAVSEGSQFL